MVLESKKGRRLLLLGLLNVGLLVGAWVRSCTQLKIEYDLTAR